MNNKLDLKTTLKNLYAPSARQPSIVDVPVMNYLMLDGTGSPQEQGFQDAASALYPLAYILKFEVRASMGVDYAVMPMEVIWTLNRAVKGDFRWTMMLLQPDFITADMVETARVEARKKQNPLRLDQVRFQAYTDGRCVQIMHRGAYDRMNDTLAVMRTYAEGLGCKLHPDTHDIYLNDVRKTRPENLRAVMRAVIVSQENQ